MIEKNKPDFSTFSGEELLVCKQLLNRLIWAYQTVSQNHNDVYDKAWKDISDAASERGITDSAFLTDLTGKPRYKKPKEVKPVKILPCKFVKPKIKRREEDD